MDWVLLLVTLPTQPGAVRLRLWRALKALGCAPLRDGAYLLPAARGAAFDPLVDEVQEHGGMAAVFSLAERMPGQDEALRALFDRSQAYADWRASAQDLRRQCVGLGETAARRRLRALAEALQALHAIDDFPGPAADQARADLDALRHELDAVFSAKEPSARRGPVPRLDLHKFKGRRWATRARPWVDRLACCWLVRRFVDGNARFVWLRDPAQLPRGAIGFDFDGARFSHVGALVSFEVMAEAFGLAADAGLRRIGAAVHVLDVGGIPVPEAPGLETILAGLRELHADDDALVAASLPVFDALYAAGVAAERTA